jgi:ATP-dependent exoDNAse (exonuclease V) beta subunit
MKLAHINYHPFDDRISFEEDSHTYTIDGDSTFTSVTTFLHHQFPAFHPEEAAAQLLTEKRENGRPNQNKYRLTAIENIRRSLGDETVERAVAALNDTTSPQYHAEKSAIIEQWNQTSKSGTKIHADIEYFYNDEPRPNDSLEYQYFMHFKEDFEREYPNYRPYRTEWTVFYKELKLAGSIDMVYENTEDGTLMIYDWKRVKEIKYEAYRDECGLGVCSDLPHTNFWHYSLQLNTYKAILESQYGKKVTKCVLVRLYPDAPDYETHECHDLHDKVRQLFENRAAELARTTP